MSSDNILLPLPRKTRQKRRSSILKTTKPFDELQNLSSRDDRSSKDRRVSFANTIKIKEFLPSKTSEQGHTANNTECADEVRTVDLPDNSETTIQISTPKGKKRRRISINTGSKIERFSLIPKLDQSFSLCNLDDDFEIFEEEIQAPLASRSSITLAENAPHTEVVQGLSLITNGEIEEKIKTSIPHTRSKIQALQSVKEKDISDMELTSCETNILSSSHESLSLCSPESLLKPLRAPKTKKNNVCSEAVLCSSSDCDTFSADKDTLTASISTNYLVDAENKQSSFSLDITCEDEILSGTDSDIHSPASKMQLGCTLHGLGSKNKDGSKADIDAIRQLKFATQHTKRNAPNQLKVDQMPSKPMLLLASPYLKQPSWDESVVLPSNGAVLSDKSVEMFMTEESNCTIDKQVESKEQNTLPFDDKPIQVCMHDELSSQHTRYTLCDENGVFPSLGLNDRDTTPAHLCNWLQGSIDTSFPLVDSSQASNNEDPPLQNVIATIKANAESLHEVKMIIESPEVVPVQSKVEHPLSVSFNSSRSLKGVVSCQQDRFKCQSMLMSPSLFSKFLIKLKCDKSILCIENSSVDNIDTTQSFSKDNVNQLSSSLAQAHISTTNVDGTFLRNDVFGYPNISSGRRIQTPTCSFSVLLETLEDRIFHVLTALQLRIKDKIYLQAHQGILPCLERLMIAANRCMCVVNVLKRFGHDSGLLRIQFDLTILETIPDIDSSSCDLHGPSDNQLKARWIQKMHHYICEKMYPTMESVLHGAASVYPWHINKWTESEMEISCHHRCIVKVDFNKEIVGTGSVGVQAIRIVSTEGNSIEDIPACSSTDDIPQLLLKICSKE